MNDIFWKDLHGKEIGIGESLGYPDGTAFVTL
jgi:hypothetical protein